MIDWDAAVLGPVMGIFGEDLPPTYTAPGSTVAIPLPGAVFDEAYHQTTGTGDGGEQTTEHPVLGVRDAMFIAAGAPQPVQSGLVTVPRTGKTFVIQDVRPDGHGHTLLILMEAR